MSTLDLLAVLTYFAVVIGAGFWYRKRAAQSLESYFLGGKRIPWYMLAMSGAVSNFDITGTMWMVSVMYILGMQSWWHHWMWGVAMPAFTLAYMAVWVRRSNVMTAAEWMVTRFGNDPGGRCARYAAAAMAILFTTGMVGYAFQGIGKFAAVYVPLEPLAVHLPFGGAWIVDHQAAVLATVVFAITTFYVVVGGLYSVVLTDVIQTVILTGAAILIVVIACVSLTPELIAEHVPAGFDRLTPSWRLPHLAGTEHAAYEMFGFLTIAWIAKGLLMNSGGPGQMYDFQRYLAASSVRDAARIAAAWPLFLVARWGMVAGITLLAMTGLLNVRDPEQVMPLVLQQYLPIGIRGVVIAGLLAAFMSTFSSTVNSGASFIVRDLWQPLFRPDADERHLVRYSYIATLAIVVGGVLIGYEAQSIAQIWGWLMMALTAGVIIPNVLRWYWWRLNGWGYAAGVLGGMLLSIVALWHKEARDYQVFPLICLGSLVASVVASYATAPTATDVLRQFFESVRPFGWWKPVRVPRTLETSSDDGHTTGAARALLNTLVGIIGLTGLYLAPMYLVGHWFAKAAVCTACFAAAAMILYFSWYRQLPPPPRSAPFVRPGQSGENRSYNGADSRDSGEPQEASDVPRRDLRKNALSVSGPHSAASS